MGGTPMPRIAYNRFMRSALLAIFLVAVAAPFVIAGQRPPNHPEMKQLDFLQGVWKGDLEYQLGENKLSGPLTLKFEPTLDGSYVQVTLENDLKAAGVVKGIGMLAYDTKKQKFAMFTFTNAVSADPTPRQETGTVEGQKLTLETGTGSPLGEMRQTWEVADGVMTYRLEMKNGDKYMPLASGTLKKG